MSHFKGTFEEFYKIINPLTRNLVANMSRKEKQNNIPPAQLLIATKEQV